jgi:citrate synthase
MTYLGAPEAMQAAVAAGLCGLGSVFVGSTEGCAKMLMESDSVESILAKYKQIPGLGHPIHKPIDPRSVRLFEIAKECGFFGRYCERIIQLSEAKKLTLNATGAIGAICCEMKLDWKAVRGLGVMARAVGLVGHLLEESREPMAAEIWHRVEAEATEHHRK